MALIIEMVEPDLVKEWIVAGSAHIIDVREPQERTDERIDGTLANPLSQFDTGAVAVPEGKKLVLHCRSGVRCGMAAERLEAAGYEGTVYRLRGGVLAWKEAGLPTISGNWAS